MRNRTHKLYLPHRVGLSSSREHRLCIVEKLTDAYLYWLYKIKGK